MIRGLEETRPRPIPIAVGTLIAINAIVFGYEMILSGGASADSAAVSEFVARWGLVAREFFREIADPGSTSQVVWFTPISSMFLHAGLIHLACNLLYLWVFGAAIEGWLGSWRFLGFYLACGLAASVFQLASDPDSYVATIGASGAISGVLGAYLASYPQRGLRLRWPSIPSIPIPAMVFLLVWIVIQILSGLYHRSAEEGGSAWWAHTGGFLTGIALARALRRGPSRVHGCASDPPNPQ